MTIRCAICDRATTNGADNPWRPFCSERCKLLDLSRWLGEEYRIAGEGAPVVEGEVGDRSDSTPSSS